MDAERFASLKDHLFCRVGWDDLDLTRLDALIALARAEDLAGEGFAKPAAAEGDVSSATLPDGASGTANVVARDDIVLCGVGLIARILAAYGPDTQVIAQAADGQVLAAGGIVATVSGPAKTLLQAERPMLNFLQMLSGVATTTAGYVAALDDGLRESGGPKETRLLDTRKTTPGYRALEKYAVACGGGWNHRLGLFDRVMLKDNHLAACGAVAGDRLAAAVRRAREMNPGIAIEVEVDRIDQIAPVLDAGADVILLDNFADVELREAVAIIGDSALTEASGGVTHVSLLALAGIGLDFISCGALTHQSTWVDIGLDWALQS